MNYCSLEDAWGSRCNQISNQYKNYMAEKNYTQTSSSDNSQNTEKNSLPNNLNVETFNNITNNKTKNIPKHKNITKNDDHHVDELYDCDSFISHVRNCRKCHIRMRNYFKPKLVENFQDIIEDNRDTIVLILIGLSILLFFNLINNMTK
jgi:hypothetical protein